jgi:hypothetical protein
LRKRKHDDSSDESEIDFTGTKQTAQPTKYQHTDESDPENEKKSSSETEDKDQDKEKDKTKSDDKDEEPNVWKKRQPNSARRKPHGFI